MTRHWSWIVTLLASAASLLAGSPDPEIARAEALYRRTEYGRAIDALQSLNHKTAASYSLLGKSYFMQGQYKLAVTNLENAIAEDNGNSEYYDWLGRAYGRIAETSSFVSAMGYAKKTVHAFERAVELEPSNLEALSDLFEYYLQAPGIVGGGMDKAENLARRFAPLSEAEHHWVLARIAEKRKDQATAEREFRAAAAAAPNEVGRYLDLAAFLSSLSRYRESDTLFREANEKHPNAPKVTYARAAAYVHSKRRLEEAQALLQRYLNAPITPDDPTPQEAAALLKQARTLAAKGHRADEAQSVQSFF